MDQYSPGTYSSIHTRRLPAQKTEAKVACKVMNIMAGLGSRSNS
jgi:hypothetical protein